SSQSEFRALSKSVIRLKLGTLIHNKGFSLNLTFERRTLRGNESTPIALIIINGVPIIVQTVTVITSNQGRTTGNHEVTKIGLQLIRPNSIRTNANAIKFTNRRSAQIKRFDDAR